MMKAQDAARLEALLRDPAIQRATDVLGAGMAGIKPSSGKDEGPRAAYEAVNAARLESFLHSIAPLASDARRRGHFIDFWHLAELGRDEIRNSRVLAWFLDARAAHGAGNAFLKAWFDALNRRQHCPFLQPSHWEDGYSIDIEVCPFRDGKNRLDLLIQSPTALVGVEVKVGASDISEQRTRYPLALAERAASGRQKCWGLIYLTPHIETATHDDCLAASWSEMASSMVKAIEGAGLHDWPSMLAFQFSRHIRSF